VVVGPLAVLDPFERLSKRRDKNAPVEDEDSDIEEIEANQDKASSILGKDSNAIVWPQGPFDNDDEDGIAAYRNQRVRRLGDDGSDLELSDEGSESSDEESDESSEYDSDNESRLSADTGTSPLATPSLDLTPSGQMQESEFRIEVAQSLERAFAEGHSVDNAAVELKTLRMASNVPLSRVREAVVAAIVEDIKIVDGALPQRKEISRVVGRWGELINKIGGVDAIETVSALQVCFACFYVIFRDR